MTDVNDQLTAQLTTLPTEQMCPETEQIDLRFGAMAVYYAANKTVVTLTRNNHHPTAQCFLQPPLHCAVLTDCNTLLVTVPLTPNTLRTETDRRP